VRQRHAQFPDLHRLRLRELHRWLGYLLVLWGDLQNARKALNDAEHGAIAGGG